MSVPPTKPWLQNRPPNPASSSSVAPWVTPQNSGLQNASASLTQPTNSQPLPSTSVAVQSQQIQQQIQQQQQQSGQRAPRPWDNAGASQASQGQTMTTTAVTSSGLAMSQPRPTIQYQTQSMYGLNSGFNSGYGGYGGYNSLYGGTYGSTFGGGVYNSSYNSSLGYRPYGTFGSAYGGSFGCGVGGGFGSQFGPNQFNPYNDPNDPIRPPNAWETFMQSLNGIVYFFGRISFLISENATALHYFITSLLQLLDRAGSLYGEIARFVLRLLGYKVENKQQGNEMKQKLAGNENQTTGLYGVWKQ